MIDIELEYCKNEANLVLKIAVSITKVQGQVKIELMKFWEAEIRLAKVNGLRP